MSLLDDDGGFTAVSCFLFDNSVVLSCGMYINMWTPRYGSFLAWFSAAAAAAVAVAAALLFSFGFPSLRNGSIARKTQKIK